MSEITVFIRPQSSVGSTDAALMETAAAFCPGAGIAMPRELTVLREGKPRFAQLPQVEFSVSHSGEWWLAAMSLSPVGLDIQEKRPVDAAALARRFFHPDEADWLEQRGEAEFFTLWAAKESYVKLTGAGLNGKTGEFSVIKRPGVWAGPGNTLLRVLPFDPRYAVVLCSYGAEQVFRRDLLPSGDGYAPPVLWTEAEA